MNEQPGSRQLYALLAVAVGAQCIIGADFSLASVAMPSIERHLNIAPAISQWILTADLVAYAGFLIVGGRLADAFGQRLILSVGLGMFLIGSVLTSISSGLTMLLVARAVQGLGGAMVYPSAFSLLTLSFPEGPKRFKAYTINMASQAVGVPLLTILAGAVITQFGWRGSFLLNVPVCAVLLALIVKIGKIDGHSPVAQSRIPYANAMILTLGMASLIYALSALVAKSEAMRAQWPYALVVAAAVLLLFVLVERRSASPLISPELVRMRSFAGGVFVVATVVLVGKALVVLSNISFQKALLFTPLQASFALLPMSVASLLLIPLSPVSGRFLLPRPRATLIGVFTIICGYYVLLSITPLAIAMYVLLAILFLAPFASVTGANMALNETLKPVAGAQQGVATAITYTVVQMFSAAGMAVILAASGGSTARDKFAQFTPSFELAAMICLAGIAITLVVMRKSSTTTNAPGAPKAAALGTK